MAHLDPGDLDIRDPGPQEEAGHRDDAQILGRSGTGPGSEHVVELVEFVDIAEGNEFGKAAGLFLNLSDQPQMGRHMTRALDMAVHQCGRGGQADGVGGLDDLYPASRFQLARRENLTDLIVKNLGGRTRQAAHTRIHQPAEIIGEFHPALTMAPIDLLGGIGVEVKIGKCVLDGGGQFPVMLVILLRVDAPLNADLRRAALHRLFALGQDGLHIVDVSVGLVLMTGETAERTAHVADIGEIYVSADHVGDVIPDVLLASPIRGPEKRVLIGPLHGKQEFGVFFRHLAAVQGRFEDGGHSRVHFIDHSLPHQAASSLDWWWGRRA